MTENYFGKKRVFVYALGLFLYALGIAIAAKTELGIAPVSTFPYALSFITPFSFGVTTFFLTVTYIGIQMALYGKGLMSRTLELADIARRRISEIPGLSVLQMPNLDQTRLTVTVSGLGLTGFAAEEILSSG